MYLLLISLEKSVSRGHYNVACEIIVTQRDVILLNSQHSYLLILLCIASSRLFIFRDPMSEVKDRA